MEFIPHLGLIYPIQLCSVGYLTDIPQQREEYEVVGIWHEAEHRVPYHFYSLSWSGISVIFYDKLTLHFLSQNKTILPNSDTTRHGLSGQSPT